MIKYILSFLLVVNTASAMNSGTRTIQANEIDGVMGFKNLVENSGFERKTRSWAASGGTFTTTTTAADIGSGSRAGSWDSNAASQTLTSTAVAIPAGDYGANYEVSANLKCASGTCTHLIQAFDGTNVIASQTITSSLTYARTALNFVAPTSGSISARIVSVNANEPNLFKDDFYLGRASNVGSVAQAQLIGSAFIAGTSSCSWTKTGTSYGAFGTTAACPGPTIEVNNGPGVIQTTDTDLPRFTVNGLPPGLYQVIITGTGQSTGGNAEPGYVISDGASLSGYGRANNSGAGANSEFVLNGIFNYTTSGDRTFNVFGAAENSNTNTLRNNPSDQLKLTIVRYPLSSEIAYRSEQMARPTGFSLSLTGLVTYQNSSTSTWQNLNSASYSSKTFIGSAITTGTANDFSFRVPYLPAGEYEVVTNVTSSSASGAACTVAVFDGTNRYSAVYTDSNLATAQSTSAQPASIIRYSSVQTNIDFTVQAFSNNTANCRYNIGSGGSQNSIATFYIKPISLSIPAPNLVGSVTSLSTGSLRVETARITNNGSVCALANQSSSWVSSPVRSSGSCSLTIATGAFSETPVCTCTAEASTTPSAECSIDSSISSTSISTTTRDSGGTMQNYTRSLICIGSRGSL